MGGREEKRTLEGLFLENRDYEIQVRGEEGKWVRYMLARNQKNKRRLIHSNGLPRTYTTGK